MRKVKKNDGKVKKSDRLKEEQPTTKRILDVERENRKVRKQKAKDASEERRLKRRKNHPRFIGSM